VVGLCLDPLGSLSVPPDPLVVAGKAIEIKKRRGKGRKRKEEGWEEREGKEGKGKLSTHRSFQKSSADRINCTQIIAIYCLAYQSDRSSPQI